MSLFDSPAGAAHATALSIFGETATYQYVAGAVPASFVAAPLDPTRLLETVPGVVAVLGTSSDEEPENLQVSGIVKWRSKRYKIFAINRDTPGWIEIGLTEA